MKVIKADEMKATRFANPHFSKDLFFPINLSEIHMKNPGIAMRRMSKNKTEIRVIRPNPKKIAGL